MIRNYFKIAIRQIRKQKMYAAIKIGGFAFSIAACLLIALYIRNETSYDKSYPDANRIFRVLMVYTDNGIIEKGPEWPAPLAKDRELNERLDRVLGVGSDLRAWLRHVADGLRVSPYGHTLLVDYGDQARVVPNFWATGFGHAAYTRREAMLFHVRLVADHFYPPDGQDTRIVEEPRGRVWMGPARLLLPRRRSPSASDA